MHSYVIQGNNIVISLDGENHVINKSHLAFSGLVQALSNQDWQEVKELLTPVRAVLKFGKGHISIEDGELYYLGQLVDNSLSRRILQMVRDGFPVEPMVNFMENLYNNPSHRSISEMYDFLGRCDLPITQDGCFLAYKKVTEDYLDVHSNTVCNKPAVLMTEVEKAQFPVTTDRGVTMEIVDDQTVVHMPRNQVDDERNNHCSQGLHFCSKDYLAHFSGQRVVVLKINPADVVSIPNDYNFAKGRTWRYVVVGEDSNGSVAAAPKAKFTWQRDEEGNLVAVQG